MTAPRARLQVALVTDGRMSGASGKVPAAIPAARKALAWLTHPAGGDAWGHGRVLYSTLRRRLVSELRRRQRALIS
jgi:hypothetical protein